MPLKGGRLTPQEMAFAKAYAATEDRRYAAWAAGYRSCNGPYVALERPAVAAKIRDLRRARLEKLGCLSLDHYERVLTDPNEATREKTKVAGLVARELRVELDREDEGRDEWDLSPAEIKQRIALLDAALSQRLGTLQDIDAPPAETGPAGDDIFG